jgi:beta-glucosidase-like glycosyl hydrolase
MTTKTQAVLICVLVLVLLVHADMNFYAQSKVVNTWGCYNSPVQQFKLENNKLSPVGLLNRCLTVRADGMIFTAAYQDSSQQKIYYDEPTQSIRNIDNTISELVCLTPTAKTTQREEYGSLALFLPCTGSNAQKWKIEDNGHISSISLLGICLDYATTWQCDDLDSPIANYPMCNNKISSKERAQDLMSRMTLYKMMNQLTHISPGIPRLGITAYDYWNEALHGVLAQDDIVTMFPQVIGLGAGFNISMYDEIAKTISTEGRALWNKNVGGLTYWAPNINIFRDPQWGRGQETPGEDPLLSATYATKYVQGMQQDNQGFTKLVSTCKHFAAYSLEEWNGVQRYGFDAIVDDQDLEETYLPAFKACVTQGKARSIMCSYNSVNGVPACANPKLLQEKLRDQWGFTGFVVADCDAVLNVYDPHFYSNTTYGATAVSLKAGTDLDCGLFYKHLPEALERGLLTAKDITQATERIFTQRIELGMFNRATNPWEKIQYSEINTPTAQQLSLVAARESMVLLKNNHTLPLDRTQKTTIGAIGPNADDIVAMRGNYQGRPPYIITPLQGIKDLLGKDVLYAKGCEVDGTDTSGFDEAIQVAMKADIIILVVGLNQVNEGEGQDRYNLTFPGPQDQLIDKVLVAAKGKLVIVVLVNGGPLDITHLRDDSRVSAILEAWYGGQSGGTAIADVLFGNYNPGGVLPITFYPQKYVDMIPLTDMRMRPYPGRTYRYLQIEPVYKFGYGLSYTRFEIAVQESVVMYRPVKDSVHVMVRNIGSRDGDFVALAFARAPQDEFTHKEGQLAAFNRVHVRVGENKLIELQFSEQSFERFRNGKMVTEPSEFIVTVTGTQHVSAVQFKVSVH